MAKSHGKATVFKVDDSGASLVDLSTDCDNVDFPQEISTGETTTFGATGSARTFVTGLVGRTISISGKFDAAASHTDATLSGIVAQAATVTYEYGPTGSTAGMVKHTGECILTSYNTSSPLDGVVSFQASFQITGANTRTTW